MLNGSPFYQTEKMGGNIGKGGGKEISFTIYEKKRKEYKEKCEKLQPNNFRISLVTFKKTN